MSFTPSLAEQYLEEHQYDDEPFNWIIAYDFIERKPSPKFWKNLEKMTSISTITRIQYSVLKAENRGDALAVARLAEHYGAIVEVFQCIPFEGG